MIHLGYISKVFGIKGGVRLKLFNDKSETLAAGLSICLKIPNKPEQNLKIAELIGSDRLLFEGINNPEQAQSLVGAQVYVERSLLAELPSDEYYLDDILGCLVVDMDDEKLGELVGFSSNNAQVLLEIKTTMGHLAYVPLVKAIVKEILFAQKKIIIDAPIGLLDP